MEVKNQIILQGLRTKLDESKDKWADKLPGVLWIYHITPQVLTNKTPFNLVFGTKVVIPIEIGLPTMRIENFDELSNSARLRSNLNLLEEIWNQAHLRMAAYWQQATRYYNSHVKLKTFYPRDFVLQRIEISKLIEQGKLSLN